MYFSERLQKLRKSKGLSQEKLGELVGVSRQAVQKWESGGANPDLENLTRLSECLQVSLDYLLKGEGESQKAMSQTSRFEYRSEKELFGMPLVHIHIGNGGRPKVARGILAIGDVAIGGIAMGGICAGLFALGGLGFGLVSIAGLAVGVLSLGGASMGYLAVGGLAIGIYAIGGSAFGMHAIGGAAFAAGLAAGDSAYGTIAIGEEVSGKMAFAVQQGVNPERIRESVMQRYPGIWKGFVELALKMLK